MKFRIGLDIGGTHTDAVLVDQNNKIVAWTKVLTTEKPEEGVQKALQQLKKIPLNQVTSINIGTTHATNAVLEGNRLLKVGVIRIAGHRPNAIPPCYQWPQHLVRTVYAGYETINGGYECDGREITPFDPKEAADAAEHLIRNGAQSLAIVGVFSPLSAEQELKCRDVIKDIPISLSHTLGGTGFIERENATILNAALRDCMRHGFESMERAIKKLGFTCPVYLTQNNGSILEIHQALDFPLLTVSSGPTNSFIGAIKLANLTDAVVVDIGGTSTDIGVILNGYPRRSRLQMSLGGVKLNFPIPDVIALSIGGGSYITKNPTGQWTLGPKSCGKRLLMESQAFGGKSLTLTDAAYLTSSLNLPSGDRSSINLLEHEAHEILQTYLYNLQYKIDEMKGNRKDLPVICVGGGAPMVQHQFNLPEYSQVANAYGAALAEVSATIDTVINLENRQKTLSQLQEKAIEAAIEKGACSKQVRVVDMQIIPYHYLPQNIGRVMITVAGPKT